MSDKPKFIRKNGKVIPVGGKGKGGKSSGKGKKKLTGAKKMGAEQNQKAKKKKPIKKISKAKASNLLSSSAKNDRKLAKTGDKVAAGSFALAAVGGIIASKKKSAGGLALGLAAGLFGVTNSGFATGRRIAATLKERESNRLSGKKNTGSGPAIIGSAAERAARNIKQLRKHTTGF